MDRKITICFGLAVLLALCWDVGTRAETLEPTGFERYALTIPAHEDTFATSPLASFLVGSILTPQPQDSSVDYVVHSRSVIELRDRLSLATPDSSASWLLGGYTLARALYRLGYADEAVEWLERVHARDPSGPWGTLALRSMVEHSLTVRDAALDSLAERWDGAIVSSDDGLSATRALYAVLYVRGREAALARLLSRSAADESNGYVVLFQAMTSFDRGDFDVAHGHLLGLFREAMGMSSDAKLAALLLEAQSNWLRGSRDTAIRQFELLSSLRSPYVRSWSVFMLGVLNLSLGDRSQASEHFARTCDPDRAMQWSEVSCLLRASLSASEPFLGKRQ